jgi:glucose 1-dehydrogenase/3-oxoacyl-[acyl-carrier protein] reductase
MKLKGKRALVTGAARGIGRGIAEVFADEGAEVAVNDFENLAQAEEVVRAISAKGTRAMAIQGDVAKRADVEPMIDRVWKELGPIDILVNNAGIETIVPFLELTDEQWTRLTDVNPPRGMALFTGVLPPRACDGTQGRDRQHRLDSGGESASRPHALRAEQARARGADAQHVGGDDAAGHRVNCIHPGLIDTPMTAWVMKDQDILPLILAQISWAAPAAARNRNRRGVSRVGRSELSDRAVDFVDGGWEREVTVVPAC